jgi:hypothetical protein
MTPNHHAGGTGRGGWHDHPRKSKQEGGGGENYTTRSHQDRRGARSIRREARTTHRRRCSIARAATQEAGSRSSSKTILFQVFQTDHGRARTPECSARGCRQGRRAASPCSRSEISASGGRQRPSALSAHRGLSRGQRTNRCSRSSRTPGQNGQWGDDTHPRRNRWARVLVRPRHMIQKNTRTRGGTKFTQLTSLKGTTHPEEWSVW